MKINLKRGYSIDIKKENQNINSIDIIGNYSKSNYKGTVIVNKNGIVPTVRENHGQVTAIVINGGNMNDFKPEVLGGIGEKKSNNGSQWYQHRRIYDNKISLCVTTCCNPYYLEGESMNNLRIRKLTPKECWRLMGFDDEDFEKAKKVCSDTQLYKQAGNSIVVNVLEKIINNLVA